MRQPRETFEHLFGTMKARMAQPTSDEDAATGLPPMARTCWPHEHHVRPAGVFLGAYPLPTGRPAAWHEFAHARSFRQHLGTRSVSRRRVGIVDDPNCVEHAFHIDAIAGDKEGR